MEKKTATMNRRNFLLATGSAGAAAIAATVVSTGATPDAEADAKGVENKGYRLTAHIAKYYKTTQI